MKTFEELEKMSETLGFIDAARQVECDAYEEGIQKGKELGYLAGYRKCLSDIMEELSKKRETTNEG